MSNSASAIVKIKNKLGLHARPAMLFVETASSYEADITVKRADTPESVDGKSIMQMMMLAATQGTSVEISAAGPDADEAIAALGALIDSKFHED